MPADPLHIDTKPSRGVKAPRMIIGPEVAMAAMTIRSRAPRKITRAILFIGFAIAIGAMLAPLPVAPASAADALPAADQACLGCHGFAGMEKKLGDGDLLKLQVPGELFNQSVHRGNGCTSCHADIDAGAHPP